MKTLIHLNLFLGLLLTACKNREAPPAAESPAADAYLILPGDYAESTTVADLEARFGKANVRRESEPEPRLVLFPDDPTRRAYVTFHDEETFETLASITVSDPGSRWRGKHGVEVGMTFAQIRELNGKPFYFQGFSDEGTGSAHDGWSPALDDDDGALGAFDVAEGDHLYFDVHFGPGDPAAEGLPTDGYLSSDDPRLASLRERIRVIRFGATSSLDDEW